MPEKQARNFGLTLTVSLDPRASLPSAPYLTVSFFSSVVSDATYASRLRALEGHCVSSKSPSRVRDGYEGVAGRNGRELCFPDEGSLICPPGKSMSFHEKETEKNWVCGQTWFMAGEDFVPSRRPETSRPWDPAERSFSGSFLTQIPQLGWCCQSFPSILKSSGCKKAAHLTGQP